jgi:hypothetical protein
MRRVSWTIFASSSVQPAGSRTSWNSRLPWIGNGRTSARIAAPAAAACVIAPVCVMVFAPVAVTASVPLAEMVGYATALRSATQGRATYTMHFDRYEPVPPDVSEAVVARLQGG